MLNLDDRWDAAVIDFCRTRYPLAVEPILVRTSANKLNDIYFIVPPDELYEECSWYPLNAIYECGEVKCYAVGLRNANDALLRPIVKPVESTPMQKGE